MYVNNTHLRTLPGSPQQVADLLESLASTDDRLWPNERWPAMRLDPGVELGAQGGHGPIRYSVVSCRPGDSIGFRFTAPAGFNGGHGFRLTPAGEDRTVIHHTLEMHTSGAALLSWPLVYRPLHDALIEDAFDKAERNLGLAPKGTEWSMRVKLLRRLLRALQAGKR